MKLIKIAIVLKGEDKAVTSAKQIKSDKQAVEILDLICAFVVTDDSGGADSRPGSDSRELKDLNFMYDCNGMWAGADFGLIVAMLLVNRAGLAHLFFAREGRRDASAMMPNALWACLICRQLSAHKDVGACSYHLKNGFEVCCPYLNHWTLFARLPPLSTDLGSTLLKKADRRLKAGRCSEYSSADADGCR